MTHSQSFSERRSETDKWLRADAEINERERKLALNFALKMKLFSPFLQLLYRWKIIK